MTVGPWAALQRGCRNTGCVKAKTGFLRVSLKTNTNGSMKRRAFAIAALCGYLKNVRLRRPDEGASTDSGVLDAAIHSAGNSPDAHSVRWLGEGSAVALRCSLIEVDGT